MAEAPDMTEGERVARTIFWEFWSHGDWGISVHTSFEHDQALWESAARAAIEAVKSGLASLSSHTEGT